MVHFSCWANANSSCFYLPLLSFVLYSPSHSQNPTSFPDLMLQSEVLNATEETLVEARDKKIVTKKLQLEDPANVPANLIDYLK